MRTAWVGSPVRGAVCLVATRGQGTTAWLPCPRADTAPVTAIAPSHVRLAGPVTGRMTEGGPTVNSIARGGNPRQAASVRGPSNKSLKRHLAVGSEVAVWGSVAARRRLTPNAFGFLPADHMSKETCQEKMVCCMMRADGYWIRSHGSGGCIRSHMVRRLCRVLSTVKSCTLLYHQSL